MISPPSSHPDAARSRLRTAIAAIEVEIARLPEQVTAGGVAGLRSSFSELVSLLALGPEPEIRECPVCGRIGMRAATLCGYCWTKLPPL